MEILDYRFRIEDVVAEDVVIITTTSSRLRRRGRGSGQREVPRVSSAEELQRVFHDFLAAQLATGEVIEDQLAVFFEESATLRDAGDVAVFELEPPVRFEFVESCCARQGPGRSCFQIG